MGPRSMGEVCDRTQSSQPTGDPWIDPAAPDHGETASGSELGVKPSPTAAKQDSLDLRHSEGVYGIGADAISPLRPE
jgi:hypothetical protein